MNRGSEVSIKVEEFVRLRGEPASEDRFVNSDCETFKQALEMHIFPSVRESGSFDPLSCVLAHLLLSQLKIHTWDDQRPSWYRCILLKAFKVIYIHERKVAIIAWMQDHSQAFMFNWQIGQRCRCSLMVSTSTHLELEVLFLFSSKVIK